MSNNWYISCFCLEQWMSPSRGFLNYVFEMLMRSWCLILFDKLSRCVCDFWIYKDNPKLSFFSRLREGESPMEFMFAKFAILYLTSVYTFFTSHRMTSPRFIEFVCKHDEVLKCFVNRWGFLRWMDCCVASLLLWVHLNKKKCYFYFIFKGCSITCGRVNSSSFRKSRFSQSSQSYSPNWCELICFLFVCLFQYPYIWICISLTAAYSSCSFKKLFLF